MMSFLGPRDVAALASVSSRFAWASASSELWSRTTLRIVSSGGAAAFLVASDCKQAVATSARPDLKADDASCPSSVASPAASEAQPLSAAGLAGLVRLHGPAIRRLEARGLDLAAFPGAPAPGAAPAALPSTLEPLSRLGGLEDLDLAGSKRLPGDVLVRLATAGLGLHRLVLAGCVNATDDHVTDILAAGSPLTELSLARCRLLGRPTLDALAASPAAATLTTLDLSGIPGISADDVIQTVLSRPRPSLRRLFLSGVRGASDALLAAVAAACPALQVLDIGASDATGCVAVLAMRRGSPEPTGKGLAALAAAPCAASLRRLGLRGRAGVALAPAALGAALAAMPRLGAVEMTMSARTVAGMLRGDAGAQGRITRALAICKAKSASS